MKGKGLFWDKLNTNIKQRYFKKRLAINNIDPYDLSAAEWSKNHYHLVQSLK